MSMSRRLARVATRAKDRESEKTRKGFESGKHEKSQVFLHSTFSNSNLLHLHIVVLPKFSIGLYHPFHPPLRPLRGGYGGVKKRINGRSPCYGTFKLKKKYVYQQTFFYFATCG